MALRPLICLAVAACAGSSGTWAMPTAPARPMIVSRHFDWFPDGRRIAFESNLERPTPAGGSETPVFVHDPGLDVFVVSRDGTGLVNLTRDNPSSADVFPTVAPDGNHVAFLRRGERDFDLVIVALDGSPPRVLARGVAAWPPTWSPEGRELTFSACCEGGRSRVYAIGPDGGGRRRIAEGSAPIAWSPDGSRIAYIGPVVGNPALVVQDRAGESFRLLTRDAVGGHAVAWSPDSTLIAFDVPAPPRRLDVGIAYISADGGAASTVVRPGSRPAWSPDGSRIAFDSRLPFRDGDVMALDVRTGAVTALVEGPRIQHSPRWSRDGAYLAYVSEAGEADWPVVGSYIEVARADGSDRVRITPESPPAMQRVVPVETVVRPDGLYVASVRLSPAAVRVGGRVRATVTVETQNWHDLVDGAKVFVTVCSGGAVVRAAPGRTRAGRVTIPMRVAGVSHVRRWIRLCFWATLPDDSDPFVASLPYEAYVRIKRRR